MPFLNSNSDGARAGGRIHASEKVKLAPRCIAGARDPVVLQVSNADRFAGDRLSRVLRLPNRKGSRSSGERETSQLGGPRLGVR